MTACLELGHIGLAVVHWKEELQTGMGHEQQVAASELAICCWSVAVVRMHSLPSSSVF